MKLFKATIFTTFLLFVGEAVMAQNQLISSDKYIFTIQDEDALRVFDRASKKLVFEKSVESQSDAEICISSDGTKLWYLNEDQVYGVNIDAWSDFKEIKKDENTFWHYYDFTFDRQFLIYSKIQSDNTLITDIYSLNTGELIKSVKQGKSEFVNSAYFDPSTNYLYTFFDRKETTTETQNQNSVITDAASVLAFQKNDGQSCVLTVVNASDNSIVFEKELFYSSGSKINFVPMNKALFLVAPYGVGKLKSLFELEFAAVANFDQFFIVDKKMYFPRGFSMDIYDVTTGTSSSLDDEEYSEVIPYADGIDYSPTKKELVVLTDEGEVQIFSISNLNQPISQFKIKE